jgi:hypothetical protein
LRKSRLVVILAPSCAALTVAYGETVARGPT